MCGQPDLVGALVAHSTSGCVSTIRVGLLCTTKHGIERQPDNSVVTRIKQLRDDGRPVCDRAVVGVIQLASVEIWRLTESRHSGCCSQSFQLLSNVMIADREKGSLITFTPRH